MKPNLKILYLCKTINSRHGGRTHAREFLTALQQIDGVEVDSYYPLDDGGTNDKESNEGAPRLWWLPPHARTFLRMILMNRRLTERVSQRLVAKHYDVLLVRHEAVRIDFARLRQLHPNLKIAIELNAILTDESFESPYARKIVRPLEFQQLMSADTIFPVSSVLKQSLLDAGVDKRKIMVNPNGVDIARFNADLLLQQSKFRHHYHVPDNKFVIGYVGGMEPYRRLPEFVKTYASLANGVLRGQVFLFMVGGGKDFTTVESVLNQLCPQASYRLLGWQNHADVPKVMATFDLAVMPYTQDYCSPLKLFEYLAMGLPTIGPETPSVRELFHDDEHLWLNRGDAANTTYLANLIGRVISDSRERETIALQGRRWVMEHYTWRANAERVVKGLSD